MVRNVAITIGVNQYQYERSLDFAEADAVAMQSYLQGIGFEDVLLYSDQTPGNHPELTNLRRVIRRISSNVRLGTEDSFWFFFSGHGGRQRGGDYLLPTNGDPEDLTYSAIAIDEVIRALRECGAGNLVLILDACRNPVPERGKSIGSQTVELVKQEGIITLFSCSPGEKSYELPDYGNGAFTYALLQALNGECAPNQCNVEKLSAHLRREVPKLTEKFGQQRPYVIAEPVEKTMQMLLPMPVAIPIPPSVPPINGDASTINLSQLKADALHATYVDQDLERAKNLWVQLLLKSNNEGDKQLALQQRLEIESRQRSPISPSPIPSITPPLTSSSSSSTALTFSYETVRVNNKGKIIERIQKEGEYYTEDLGNGITFNMVKIPGGSFDMGSADGEGDDDERPQHRVTVSDFYMGKFVVTQAVYEKIMGKNPSNFKGKNRPVERVSWYDAIAFCKKLSERTGNTYRLPSESEWEYACRAETTTPFYFGPTITTDIANYNGNYIFGSEPKGKHRKETTPAGSFPPNAYGLFDMHGNVWE